LIEINKEVYQNSLGTLPKVFGCGQNQIDTVIRFKIIKKSVDSYCWSPENQNIGALLRRPTLLIWMQFLADQSFVH
jgi:hypothetical protein